MTDLFFSSADHQQLLRWARACIAHHLGEPLSSFLWSDDFLQNKACFITLFEKENHGLRGCIGSILPYQSLVNDIRDNAINAAFRDPRFPPIESLDELDVIKLEISILTPPKRVKEWHDIQIGRDGIILSVSRKSALFLPQVPVEQNWNLETTLNYLALKAGLPVDAWLSKDAKFETFNAEVFGE